MYDGLPKLALPWETKLVAFADDGAVVIVSKYLEINYTFDLTFETIHRWMDSPFIRNLGVMIDARLNFKEQAEHVGTKASGVKSTLSCLMLNIGGPNQRRRVLLSSVVTSMLTYGIPIFNLTYSNCKKHGVLAVERRSLYQRTKSEPLCAEELATEERRNRLSRWQQKWADLTKGRWTHRLVPKVDVR
ncbi:uncharacterized protein LOC107046794 [Diachasma alloeum]|uniref:uncharacterized protein LOC107046794 n=1 Tax=Diachasma alloeum TaxID=454923 RepID=UPI00073837A0|nr:uncharacterized protein LOC107046794 [Diachasma alloeum]